jgi:polysaccharide biosynthesis protein PslF
MIAEPQSRSSSRTKLLLISAPFLPLRVAEADHAVFLSQHLADSGLDVQVLTTKQEIGWRYPNVTVHPIMQGWSWSQLPRLLFFLIRCRPNAILILYMGLCYDAHPMITFLPTLSKLLFPSVPFVTQFEQIFGSATPRGLWGRILRKSLAVCLGPKTVDYSYGTLLRDSDRVVVLCRSHGTRLSEHLPAIADKCVVIPPPPLVRITQQDSVLRDNVRLTLRATPQDVIVMYFGRIYAGKGIETLLEAFRIVVSRRPNVRLVLLGGLLDDKFMDSAFPMEILLRQHKYTNKIIWVREYASGSEEPSLYLHAADICVLPFDHGVRMHNSSFAAAAAHGLPIITTQGSTVEPELHPGLNVVLCQPKSPSHMAEAIHLVIEDTALRATLASGSLLLAQECFSWNRAIKLTTESLLIQPSPPSGLTGNERHNLTINR